MSHGDESVSYFDAFIPTPQHYHIIQKAEHVVSSNDLEYQHTVLYLGVQKLDAGESLAPASRYFQSLSNIADFEESVLHKPNEPQLWINYASHLYSINAGSTLQILARGLENNRTSTELWMFYCELYLKVECDESVRRVFNQATGFVNDITLWWRWLTWERSSSMKLDILEKMYHMVCKGVFSRRFENFIK